MTSDAASFLDLSKPPSTIIFQWVAMGAGSNVTWKPTIAVSKFKSLIFLMHGLFSLDDEQHGRSTRSCRSTLVYIFDCSTIYWSIHSPFISLKVPFSLQFQILPFMHLSKLYFACSIISHVVGILSPPLIVLVLPLHFHSMFSTTPLCYFHKTKHKQDVFLQEFDRFVQEKKYQ